MGGDSAWAGFLHMQASRHVYAAMYENAVRLQSKARELPSA